MTSIEDYDALGAISSDEEDNEVPELVSDGKRMRKVWKSGDGNGESSAHVVERSMNLVKGHPTWKIFIDEVTLPIVRGSPEEPPHYCYLDDRACYAIYCSRAYSNAELREFWPWDFNHQGNIKQGRKNRGHPAYLDDSNTEYAQGRLRARNQWYTFSGEPEVTEYKPLRPKKRAGIRQGTEQGADDAATDVNADTSFNTPTGRGMKAALPSVNFDLPRQLQEAAKSKPGRSSKPEATYGLTPRRLPPKGHASSPRNSISSPSRHHNSPGKAGSLGMAKRKRQDDGDSVDELATEDLGAKHLSKRRFPGHHNESPSKPSRRRLPKPLEDDEEDFGDDITGY